MGPDVRIGSLCRVRHRPCMSGTFWPGAVYVIVGKTMSASDSVYYEIALVMPHSSRVPTSIGVNSDVAKASEVISDGP